MGNSKIKEINAREILDSRGNPTIEVELKSDSGVFFSSVPSGASKGKYEALELRDENGKNVLKAIKNIKEVLAPHFKGKDPTQQKELDELMINLDGTKDKSRLGANAILGISMAVCRAGAGAKKIPLYKHLAEIVDYKHQLKMPFSCFNIINGGAHAGNELDVQEFMIVPCFEPFSEAIKIAAEIYQQLKEIIKKNHGESAVNVGDEGGFAPPFRVPEEALFSIREAIKKLNYQDKVKIILDVAASQFYNQEKYELKFGVFNGQEFLTYYLDLIEKYPEIIGLEDPFFEEDWQAWQMINSNFEKSKSEIMIIADDLTATNVGRIKEAKEKKACNALIIKPNQIGTVSETLEAVNMAKSFGWKIIVSHRSGETCDDFIADLAVGIGSDFIKSGAPAQGERLAKYNRLLKIEEELLLKN